MSVPVELGELQERLEEYGPVAFLVTVGDDARPHIVSVSIAPDGDVLTAGAGRTTARNIGSNPTVSLVWAARPAGDYCLIVDGGATVVGETVEVRPTRAVLHRLAGAGDGPSCITVL